MASHFSLQLLLPCMGDSSSVYHSFLGAAQMCPPAFTHQKMGLWRDSGCKNASSRTACASGSSTSALELPNTHTNLDAMILMGASQPRISCSSMILSWGQERDYLCWPCVSHVLDIQNTAAHWQGHNQSENPQVLALSSSCVQILDIYPIA